MLELVEGDLYNRLAGMTGLHLAASDGALETVRLLLDARADAAAKDNKGAVKSKNVAKGYGEDKLRQTWKAFLFETARILPVRSSGPKQCAFRLSKTRNPTIQTISHNPIKDCFLG